MRKLTVVSALRLPIAEVREIEMALENAKISKNLSGIQRSQIEEAVVRLKDCLADAFEGDVTICENDVLAILRILPLVLSNSSEIRDLFGVAMDED